jgi:adenylosuccinate lyase
MNEQLLRLNSLSPLDGRYAAQVADLSAYLSEAALFRYRARVEIEYLIFLARARNVDFLAPLTAQAQGALRELYRRFRDEDLLAIAEWDRKVNHDVKAVEYWLRGELVRLGLSEYQEAVHFALTSEDVNNLAYSMMLRDARDLVLLPALQKLQTRLRGLADDSADTAMLARTHGQPATPTTFGKEINVFWMRLQRASGQLSAIRLTGKLNGASGSFAAQVAALPQVDWPAFSRAFVRSLELEPLLLTTQIEPHDTIAELSDALKRVNTILIDLSQDSWRYISDGYLVQAARSNEVGSSTMPHKVNPIDFENAEGNLALAGALLEFFSRKLPISRLQRDLSDSTVLRSLAPAFGYCLFGYQRLLRGLEKVAVNPTRLAAELEAHPEVLAEAVQTILRRVGYPEPYEALKGLTRGRALTLDDLIAFVQTLDVSDSVRAELLQLTPQRYTGIAGRLARLRDEGTPNQWPR